MFILVAFVTLYSLGGTASIAEPVSIKVSHLEGVILGLVSLGIFFIIKRKGKNA